MILEKLDFFHLLTSENLFMIIVALFVAITIATLLRFVGKKSGEAVSTLMKDKDKK